MNIFRLSAKSDGAPAFRVHVQLGDLLLKRGDSAGAHREYAAALALGLKLCSCAQGNAGHVEERRYHGLQPVSQEHFKTHDPPPSIYSLRVAAFALVATPAGAQISFTTAVDLALKNSPRVLMAKAEVDKAVAALAQTRDIYIPTLVGGSGLGWSLRVSVGATFDLQLYIPVASCQFFAAGLHPRRTRIFERG